MSKGRFFNRSERRALYLIAGGRCECCGVFTRAGAESGRVGLEGWTSIRKYKATFHGTPAGASPQPASASPRSREPTPAAPTRQRPARPAGTDQTEAG